VDRTRVHADPDGYAEVRFVGRDAPFSQALCAGAAGHVNGESVLFAGDPVPDPVVVLLAPLDLADHAAYRWVAPAPDADPDDLMACGTCHKWQYDEWSWSRHARMAGNGHVGFERERMLAAGVEGPDDCRGCHQPGDAVGRPGGGWTPRGTLAAAHCDVCHKVQRVEDLRESGVFGALVVLRPDPASTSRPGGIHHVFGPSPDATYAYMGASYDPLFEASHFCAGCHQGGGRWREGGAAKVDTFEEWRAWAAGREDDRFRSCQDCHMPSGATVTEEGKPVDQLAWDASHRRPGAVHGHRFEGTEPDFAGKSLDVRVAKRREGAEWVVEISVTNVGAGHRIPTGTWSKHVLVGVWARQGDAWLRRTSGDRILAVEDAPADALAAGDWRNPAGLVLGVRLADAERGVADPPPFWSVVAPSDVVDDRLAPGETRTAACRFEAGDGSEPVVEVRVVHRRGTIGAGPASTPWPVHAYDPMPETPWIRLTR
jgi:hypothetical protein